MNDGPKQPNYDDAVMWSNAFDDLAKAETRLERAVEEYGSEMASVTDARAEFQRVSLRIRETMR